MRKRIISLLVCLFLLFTLTACGEADLTVKLAFDKDVRSNSLSDTLIAENDTYRLDYDDETGGVFLTEIATGNTWGTTPIVSEDEVEYDALGMPIKKHSLVQSVLYVEYRDTITYVNTNVDSYSGAKKSGRIVCKKFKNGNGVTIEYYFDEQEFMIPVDFVLNDDYVSVSIDPARIQENAFPITSISLAPFWCSVKNDAENSYLFIPSGSGAIADNTTVSISGRAYKSYVYGQDLSMEELYSATNEKGTRLPVYGAKIGDIGAFAIIDKGSDSALINATSGSTAYKYSSVYASFQMRGYTQHQSQSFNSTTNNAIYADNMIDTPVSVRFYPLTGEKASYSGMADVYRDYLIDECGLSKNGEDATLSLNLVGGTMITKSFLGVPYTTLYPTTTISQASDIISEIDESVEDDITVKLTGFGATGVDIGKVAGGYTVGGNLGSVSQLKSLGASAKEAGIDLFMDFDIVRYNSSGAGFSYFGDAVMTAGAQKADTYVMDIAVRNRLEDKIYRLLSPSKLVEATEKLIDKTASWNLAGISLANATSVSYSDYTDSSNPKYYSKSYFGEQISTAAKAIKDSGSAFMASDANLYAALAADIITEAPTASSNANFFIEDVPFYAMVFKGYVPMTTESINLSSNADKTILAAVEGGIGLNYTLISEWNNVLIDANYTYFYSTLYEGVKDDIIANSERLSDYYSKVEGAHIASSSIVSSGVHCTVFDNGVTVYVNYNDSSAETPAGTVEAMDYLVSGGAAQ